MARRTFARSFGRVVRKRRGMLGLTQEALAHQAGVHRTHVGLIERGERSPSLDVARSIALALETELSTLVLEAERS